MTGHEAQATPNPDATHTSDAAPDPAEALAIVQEQQALARKMIKVDGRIFYSVWGLAWLLGYLTLWLSTRSDPQAMPPVWAFVVYGTLLAAAAGLSVAHSVRRSRGIRGVSQRGSALYGWAWAITFSGGMSALGYLTEQIESPSLVVALYNLVASLIVGSLYMGAGALTDNPAMYAIGAWMVVIAAAATMAGVPATYLVMALGGGGGLLVGAAAEQVRRGRLGAGHGRR
jgi:hypothetical protein